MSRLIERVGQNYKHNASDKILFKKLLEYEDVEDNIKTIADHYGYENQSRQLIEEMAELMVAINKYYRVDKSDIITVKEYLNVEYLLDNIHEEIADVEVMLSQIKYLLDCQDKVEQVKQEKIKRQLDRLGIQKI